MKSLAWYYLKMILRKLKNNFQAPLGIDKKKHSLEAKSKIILVTNYPTAECIIFYCYLCKVALCKSISLNQRMDEKK